MSENNKEEIILNYYEKVKEYYKKREEEMLNCNHLLLKLEEGTYYGAFHSSDCETDPSTVYCLKCGFTSKYITYNMYEEKKYEYMAPKYYYNLVAHNNVFMKQFGNGYRRGGKSFDDSVFNKYLISKNEIIPAPYPDLLYKIAKKMKPDSTNKETFKIMQKVFEIMTDKEKYKSSYTLEEYEDLLKRYNELNGPTLKMKPRRNVKK